MSALRPENRLIFRIANVPWILENGLCYRNSPERDPNYVEIGNPELIQTRTQRTVTILPGGKVGPDYAGL